MTQDEIIHMAQGYEPTFTWAQLQAAVLAEREACAKLCDEIANRYKTGTDLSHELLQTGFLAAEYCAHSVRTRGAK